MAKTILTVVVGLLTVGMTLASCPSYSTLATASAASVNLEKYQGIWYEVASKNIPGTGSCHCTQYNFTLETATTFKDDFFCRLGGPTGKPLELQLSGKQDDPSVPGALSESPFSLLPFGAPYWVIDLKSDEQGEYTASLVYACVNLVVSRAEYIYMFTRKPFIEPKLKAEWLNYLEARAISTSGIIDVPHDC
eukprot:Colp12_sorted_trinity150504_noHs@9250